MKSGILARNRMMDGLQNVNDSNHIEKINIESKKSNRKYRMLDNFGQELYDFDIVIMSSYKNNNPLSEIGVYYNACTFVLEDFDHPNSKSNAVALIRGLLWETGQYPKIVDRIHVEIGSVGGEYRMKNIIKVENPTDEMIRFRAQIIKMLSNYTVLPNVQRNIVNDVIANAKGAKLIQNEN
jgi:hypothetical protein